MNENQQPERAEAPARDLTLFIPAEHVAVCADARCGGYFYAPGRLSCPGCGSTGYVLVARHEEALL